MTWTTLSINFHNEPQEIIKTVLHSHFHSTQRRTEFQ